MNGPSGLLKRWLPLLWPPGFAGVTRHESRLFRHSREGGNPDRRPHREETPRSGPGWASILLLAAVLVLPRLARLLWHEAWLEDTDYMHAALLVSRGLLPFQDFPSPHFPLLEWLLGSVYVAVGPSLRAAEICTQITVAGTAFILYRVVLVRRGYSEAILAAALYSCSSLVFRYHLFEREVYTNFLLALGILVVLQTETLSKRRLGLLILVGGAAALVKLTALVEWLGLVPFLLVARRERGRVLLLPVGLGLFVLAAATLAVSVFGEAFTSQVYLFHTLKGRLGSFGGHLRLLRDSLDVSGILGLAGLGLMIGSKEFRGNPGRRAELLLVAGILAFTLGFYLFLSPTFWPHNAIPLLIPLSWLGSIFIVWSAGQARRLVREGSRGGAVSCGFGLALIFVGLFLFPLRNDHWQRGSVFGFGFQSRAEIRQVARAVAANSNPGERIIAPAYVAVEAGRMKLIHYREVAGPISVIEEAVQTGTLPQLRERLRNADFFSHLFQSSAIVGGELAQAIRDHSVPVVVPDSRFSLVSETRIREAYLQQHGYGQVLATEHYSVWTIAARDRTNPTR